MVVVKKKIKEARSFYRRLKRIIWNSAEAFIQNDDTLKASALTYYTLISIVPFLAVAFGIATGFGFDKYLEKELKVTFEDQQEAIVYAIKFARSLLQNVRGSVLAGVGIIALFWTNLSMLASIESALNDIWKVKQPRTWAKKFTDYLAVMIICPLVFVVSSSLSVYIITRITETAKANKIVEIVSPYLLFFFKIVPFFLSMLLFVVIYLFIPNAKVNTKPRIIAGILAGIAFQLWQWIYIRFQVEISNYGAIYGTFAALPLFLLWLQVSWLIALAGAELAAQIENEMAYKEHPGTDKIDITSAELGVLVVHRCFQAFKRGEPPPSAFQIAQEQGISVMAVQSILEILEVHDVLVQVGVRGTSKIGYQPSKDAPLFTIKSVCDAVNKHNEWSVSVQKSKALKQIVEAVEVFDRIAEESSSNLTLDQLELEIEESHARSLSHIHHEEKAFD